MRYELTYHPNQDCLTIHVDKVLTNEMIEMFETPEGGRHKPKPFVRDVFKIAGVEQVTLRRYKLEITKGGVFAWDEIIPSAIKVLLMHLCPKEKAEEANPPRRYHIDERGFVQYEPVQKGELHTFELSNIAELLAKS